MTEATAEILWTGVLIEPRHPAVTLLFNSKGARCFTGMMMSHKTHDLLQEMLTFDSENVGVNPSILILSSGEIMPTVC